MSASLLRGRGWRRKRTARVPARCHQLPGCYLTLTAPNPQQGTPRVLHQAAFAEGRGWHAGNIRQCSGQGEGKLRLPRAVCVVSGAEQMSSPRIGTKTDAVTCRTLVFDSEPCADSAKMKPIWKQFEFPTQKVGPYSGPTQCGAQRLGVANTQAKVQVPCETHT